MGRTNIDIDIDDALVAEVMRRYGMRTKRAAVALALQHLVGYPMSHEEALTTEGSGWDGDLEELRSSRPSVLE